MIASIHNIRSLEHSGLEPYKTLKQPLKHLQQGIFIAEGEKVVQRLLASGIRVYSLLLSNEWFEIHKPILEKHRDTIDVLVGEKKLLDSIVGHKLHQAIMAIGQVPKARSIDNLINEYVKREKFLAVVVDGITNSENLGVILRNCACFDVDALIKLPNSCDPYLRRSVRNSMGNIFQLPIVHISNMKSEVEKMKNNGMTIYAAHPHKNSKDIRTVLFNKKAIIVFGAEGSGISKEVLEFCDEYVSIPMKKGIDSLNVASASAIILHYASSSQNN